LIACTFRRRTVASVAWLADSLPPPHRSDCIPWKLIRVGVLFGGRSPPTSCGHHLEL